MMSLQFLSLLLVLRSAGRLAAVDFVRGDVNGDGEVTISDAHALNSYIFMGRRAPDCMSAGDADDNSNLEVADSILILNAEFFGSPSIPSPFPGPGPDPTQPEDLPCTTYGGGTPFEDPAARLEVLAAFAPGGQDWRAVVSLAISSTGPIAGYSGVIVDEAKVFETSEGVILSDQTGLSKNGFGSASLAPDGRLTFGFLTSLMRSTEIPPGEGQRVADFSLCLKRGVPAGEYPLHLQAGELVCKDCPDDGRAIRPILASGTLTVEADVAASAHCHTDIPPPPEPINVRFQLEDATGVRGGGVSVPFSIRADRASQGFSYSIHFDEQILDGTGTDKLYRKPDGTPYEFERFEIDNDTGYMVGAAVISLTDTGDVLPPNQPVRVLELDFLIDPLAPIGSTRLEFLDGGRGSGGAVTNKLIAGGSDITPSTAESFVFVNALINIIPDGTPFVRGDSNMDRGLNIADPQFTLSYLFLGGESLPCPDAADSTDDGKVNITDPVATLLYLFAGGFTIPPPFGIPGLDPTPDDLGCAP